MPGDSSHVRRGPLRLFFSIEAPSTMQIRYLGFSRPSSTVVSNLAATLGLIGLLAVGLAPSPTSAQSPTPVTSILNGSSDTALEVNYNGSLLAPGTFVNDGTENDSIPAEGAGTRMMWYPEKAAFRAGQVGKFKDGTQWDASNVGAYSVAFGVDTKASGFASTAMGGQTTASGLRATAMGHGTTASGGESTAMGFQTIASGNNATAMGAQTTAISDNATAMGANTEASGFAATAMGNQTIVAGVGATAMGQGTVASRLAATAMGSGTTASGRAATAMGQGTTAATDESVSIGECNGANSESPGDATLFVVGNGSFDSGSDSCPTRSDALVLKKDGDLAVGPSDPKDLRLFVRDDKDNVGVKDNPSANMVLLENTSDGTRPDVMGLQAGPSSPGGGVAYLTFYDRTGTTVGQVEGNGSGGVSYSSQSADFAEELPVEEGSPDPEAGDLIGVRGGEAGLHTKGDDRVMIASTAPIMTGNVTPDTKADDHERVAVAFVGQVPAKVRGTAEVGDLIVTTGENDGTGRAVAPNEYRRPKHGPIAGQAWSAKETATVGEVTVAVGLGRSGAVAERLEKQQKQNDKQKERIAELEAENDRIKKRLAALETGRSPSVVAGLTGSGAGLLLAFLMGGLLGAGLLWRRRG